MSRYTEFDEKRNTLYILSDYLLPNTLGMTVVARRRAYDEAFKMSYPERLEKFCKNPEVKKAIQTDIEAHKGCKLSEFCNA